MHASWSARPGRRLPPARLGGWLALIVAAHASAAPVPLAEAERLALGQDPGAQAYEAEAVAYGERAVAARRLPDPEARVGTLNLPVDSFSASREDMTMVELGVMQRFPNDRDAQGRRLDALAAGQRAQAEARRREVLKGLRVAWFEAAATRRTREAVAAERGLLERMAAASRAAYASGEGGQAEVLAARLETAMLDERELELREAQAREDAALARWLGAGVEPLLELPRPAPPRPLAELEAALDRHPLHEGLSAQVDAAHAEVDAARAKFRPEFSVDVGYGFRRGRMADGASRSDLLSAMVRFDLPLFTRDRQRRELAAAQQMQRSAALMREDHRRELAMALKEAHARATRANDALALLEGTVQPNARAAAEAALAAYRAGSGTYEAALGAARARLEADTRLIRAQADLAIAGAEIAALIGDEP
jgi:outer membrane protein TolC